jgi:hypothetical protein
VRSSALSRQWRVIYAVRGEELTVFVLEVNPHDYRKKDQLPKGHLGMTCVPVLRGPVDHAVK